MPCYLFVQPNIALFITLHTVHTAHIEIGKENNGVEERTVEEEEVSSMPPCVCTFEARQEHKDKRKRKEEFTVPVYI